MGEDDTECDDVSHPYPFYAKSRSSSYSLKFALTISWRMSKDKKVALSSTLGQYPRRSAITSA
jgi:hypothetical protein